MISERQPCAIAIGGALRFPALQPHGIDEIPHGRPPIVYKKLLQGIPWKTQLETILRRDDAAVFVPDADLPAEFDLVANVPEDVIDAAQPQIIDEEDEDMYDELARMLEELPAENDSDVVSVISEHPASNMDLENNVDEGSVAASDPPSLQHEPSHQEPFNLLDDNGRLNPPGAWGAQYIASKQPTKAQGGHQATFGAYEGVCRWHKKNEVTGCKKFFRIQGPTPEDASHALRRCKFWLSQAPTVDRQRKHLYCVPTDHPPSNDVLEAMKLGAASRPLNLLTDDELDRLDVEALTAKASSSVVPSSSASASSSRPPAAPLPASSSASSASTSTSTGIATRQAAASSSRSSSSASVRPPPAGAQPASMYPPPLPSRAVKAKRQGAARVKAKPEPQRAVPKQEAKQAPKAKAKACHVAFMCLSCDHISTRMRYLSHVFLAHQPPVSTHTQKTA